jgi:hypothetical protein
MLLLSGLLLLLQVVAYHSRVSTAQDLPVFINHPVSEYVLEGDLVTLNCTVTETPHFITYIWTVNNTELTNGTDGYTINGNQMNISSFSSSHNGDYSCLVTNGSWTIKSVYANLEKAYHQPISPEDTTVTVKRNEYAVLDCTPTPLISAPPVDPSNIEWAIFGSLVNSPIKGVNGSLFLRNIQETRRYLCRVETKSGTISRYVDVTVDGEADPPPSPTVLSLPQDISITATQTGYMDCIIGGIYPSVVWVTPNNSNAEFTLGSFNDEYLTISNVGANEMGIYQCNAENITGSPFTATLSVIYPPVLTLVLPSFIQVMWGHNFTLTCSTGSTDDGITWSWYQNGQPIPGDVNYITVDIADLSHEGAYQCFASNQAGVATSSTLVQITVISPSINQQLDDQLAFIGRELYLHCNATGVPPPIYQWMKDNTILSNSAGIDLTVPHLLKFTSLDRASQGNYTCIVSSSVNGLGNDSTTSQLIVVDETVITSMHTGSLTVSVGGTIILNCSAKHDSMTTISMSWEHNGVAIASNSRVRLIQTNPGRLDLVIDNAMRSDEGSYRCLVDTSYTYNPSITTNSYSPSTAIDIIDSEVVPIITSIQNISSSSVDISWSYNGFHNIIQHYRIDRQTSDGSDWTTVMTVPPTVTNGMVAGLMPYTRYTMRVVVVFNDGRPDVASLPYSITTLEDVPSGPPTNVRAESPTTTSISLNWEAPIVSDRNGIIIDYTILYGIGTLGAANISVDSNATHYILSNVEANSMYLIAISAHTSAGMGPFSNQISILTDGLNVPVHQRIWFIFIMGMVAFVILVIVVAIIIGAVRWKKRQKGRKYPVANNGNSFRMEEVDFSPDVVAHYENRKKIEPLESMYPDENGSEISNPAYYSNPTYYGYGYASSNDGSNIRLGIPIPPAYVNPPTFEDTLRRKKSNHRRSASMSLLEKAEHLQLHGSGWSVGHNPKLAFDDSMINAGSIDKPDFYHMRDDVSGVSDNSRYRINTLANGGSQLSTFV